MVTPSRAQAPSHIHDRGYIPEVIDQLGLYDASVDLWLGQSQFDYGSREVPNVLPLRRVKASPERAFAEASRQFKDMGEREAGQRQLPLPIASFTRTDMVPDPTRFNCNKIRRLGRPGSGYRDLNHLRRTKDELFTARYPLPFNFSFQVDYWTRADLTLDQFRVWTALQFRHGSYGYFPVDFTSVSRHYGNLRVFTTFSGLNDTSDLETGNESRVKRATCSLELQGWLFFPVEIVKSVLTSEIQFLQVTETVIQEVKLGLLSAEDAADSASVEETITHDGTIVPPI